VPSPPLWVFVCEELGDVDEECGVELVAVAPFEEGVVRSDVPPDDVVVGVSTLTGMLDEPAETVDEADAAPPPAASLHAKRTAGTPSGPSK